MNATDRRYYLDWLRVLAILMVFVYHSTRFFNVEDWVIKNAMTYPAVQSFTDFLGVFGMPLIFVVSGASLYFALGKVIGAQPELGRIVRFVQGLAMRLLLPVVVGIATFSLLQVYLERITHNQFQGGLLDFLPHYFDGFYGFGGNFPLIPHHLWYLEILFAFSVIFLPLLLWLKSGSGATILTRLGDLFAVPGAPYLLALPVVLAWDLMDRNSFLGSPLLGWSLTIYAWFFLVGFLIISSQRLQERIRRLRWVSLALGSALMILSAVTVDHRDLVVWPWILAILGFGMQFMNRKARRLPYANEAVMPFYILHQNVLVWVGYFIVQWPIPDLFKYLIIAPSSFAIIAVLYEFVVRRSNLLRLLFGMKPLPQMATALPALTSAQPKGL